MIRNFVCFVILTFSGEAFSSQLCFSESVLDSYGKLEKYFDRGNSLTYELDSDVGKYILRENVDFTTRFIKGRHLQAQWNSEFALREIRLDLLEKKAYVVNKNVAAEVTDFELAITRSTGVSSLVSTYVPAILGKDSRSKKWLNRHEFLPASEYDNSLIANFSGDDKSIIYCDGNGLIKYVFRAYGRNVKLLQVISYQRQANDKFWDELPANASQLDKDENIFLHLLKR